MREGTWQPTIGAVSVLAGLLFLFWPGVSLTAVVLLTGVSALVIGAGEVAHAIVMHREAAGEAGASTT
jgi:uncharacterized membrane protein HdeD (DUF308 family)